MRLWKDTYEETGADIALVAAHYKDKYGSSDGAAAAAAGMAAQRPGEIGEDEENPRGRLEIFRMDEKVKGHRVMVLIPYILLGITTLMYLSFVPLDPVRSWLYACIAAFSGLLLALYTAFNLPAYRRQRPLRQAPNPAIVLAPEGVAIRGLGNGSVIPWPAIDLEMRPNYATFTTGRFILNDAAQAKTGLPPRVSLNDIYHLKPEALKKAFDAHKAAALRG